MPSSPLWRLLCDKAASWPEPWEASGDRARSQDKFRWTIPQDGRWLSGVHCGCASVAPALLTASVRALLWLPEPVRGATQGSTRICNMKTNGIFPRGSQQDSLRSVSVHTLSIHLTQQSIKVQLTQVAFSTLLCSLNVRVFSYQ